MAEDFDLFGRPMPEGYGKRGRPAHYVTPENINKVKMLLAFGWSNERIAGALGISQPTLRKNYFQVLKERFTARDQMEAARAMRLWELAMAGNVGAFREFTRALERNDALLADKAYRGEEPEAKAEKLGKKELARQAAEGVEKTDDWGEDLQFRGRSMN